MASRNGHAPSPTPMSTLPEPTFQFRGVFLPAEVVQRLIEKKVSGADIKLLILVEAMVKCRGHGCYASNAYLARSIRVAELSIPRSIRRLVQAGLLVRYEKDGQRYLETEFSRPMPEEEINQTVNSANQTVNSRLNQVVSGELTGRLTKDNTKDEGLEDRRDGPPNGTSRTNGHAGRLNGFSGSQGAVPPEECCAWAKEFRKILRDHQRPVTNYSDRKGAEAFHDLLKRLNHDEERISRLLANYRRFIKAIERPTISSVHEITDLRKFLWIEDQLKRLTKKCPDGVVERDGILYRRVGTCDGWTEVPVHPTSSPTD